MKDRLPLSTMATSTRASEPRRMAVRMVTSRLARLRMAIPESPELTKQ